MEAGDRRRAPGVWDGGRHEASGAPGRGDARARDRQAAWAHRLAIAYSRAVDEEDKPIRMEEEEDKVVHPCSVRAVDEGRERE